ncbi:hypothetical protein HOLleu_30221 [Holothuria leucospilota]|uniref:Uncharacterized protein n=1 Tax=Holothuria leucospilota TaxID=206669 RepID=A0A9Q1BKD6_HOLLE|nr:hypothetical protein HOLleu_30221 [Holothuria leucospilota]
MTEVLPKLLYFFKKNGSLYTFLFLFGKQIKCRLPLIRCLLWGSLMKEDGSPVSWRPKMVTLVKLWTPSRWDRSPSFPQNREDLLYE